MFFFSDGIVFGITNNDKVGHLNFHATDLFFIGQNQTSNFHGTFKGSTLSSLKNLFGYVICRNHALAVSGSVSENNEGDSFAFAFIGDPTAQAYGLTYKLLKVFDGCGLFGKV